MNIFTKTAHNIGEFLARKGYTGIFDTGRSSKSNFGKKNELELYEISLYLNKAISKRAEKLSEIEFYLKNTKGERVDPAKDQKAKKILDLLAKPNNFFTGKEFFKLYQQYKDIAGEAFIFIESLKKDVFEKAEAQKLYLLPPQSVKINFTEGKDDYKDFEYTVGGKKTIYEKDRVIRSFNPSPANPLRAESIITAGKKNVVSGLNMDEYQATVLENGGRIESIMKVKTAKLTELQLKEMKDSYAKQYAEAKKSGIPLFVGGDSDYQSVGLKPSELAYLESKNCNLNDICIMTGVPKVLLANVDDVKYSNSEESKKIFLQDTIVPLMLDLTTKLNEFLVPDDYELCFVDPTPEDRDEKRKDAESVDKLTSLSLNEKREILGKDPVENGDDILVPMNMVPLSQAVAEPEPVQEQLKPKEEPKKNQKKKIKSEMLRDESKRRAYFKAMDRKLTIKTNWFKRLVKNYLKGQKERVLESLGKKAIKGDTHFFNQELEIKIAFDKFYPALLEVLRESGSNAMQTDYDFVLSGKIRSWLDSKTKIFATQINDTTFKALEKQFEVSLTEGETREQLISRIEDTYGDISKGRAETIARTEIHGTMQKGTIEGYEQSGMRVKIWVAVMDSETRDSHRAMDGEEVSINSAFSNGLMFPGDPSGDASETINCRCTI